MKNKKAVTIGMVFVFMIAAIIFGVIMIFGYKAISDFIGRGEEVEFYRFKADLEGGVKRIYREYGSVRIEEFRLPPRYERICFVDLEADFDKKLCGIDPYACDVWEGAGGDYEGADENVFLKPIAPITIKVFRIEVEGGEIDGALCLPIEKGRFRLRLEGKGDRTRISPALKS